MKKKKNGLNKGKWQVMRERCYIADTRQDTKDVEPIAVGNVLPGLMKSLGLEEDHWLVAIDSEWSSIVGQAVAEHTRPGHYDKRVLTVFVDSSSWLNEIFRYGRKQLLSNLQNKFGSDRIRSIRLEIDPEGS